MRAMHNVMLVSVFWGAATAALATPPSVGEGLKAPETNLTWARWQARLSLGVTAPAWRANLKESEPVGLRVGSFSVSGDYYFTSALFEQVTLGGVRATSGLVVGPRSQALTGQPTLASRGTPWATELRVLAAAPLLGESTADVASLPYFGVGYTGLSQRGKWSVSADLGVMALHPGNAVRFGRVFGGGQSFDDVMRDLRWAPVLQMGVSYAF
jgi:hypothetical protein